jgi:hypothetical protein
MAEHTLQFRNVSPDELLSEDAVQRQTRDAPFLDPWDRPEPYRTLYLAAARMRPIFDAAHVRSPFLVSTPRGRGLLWRWWPHSIGVVLIHRRENDWLLDDHVTFLAPEEFSRVSLDLTQIVLNPPQW